jgi:hypothetical protein
MFAISITSCYHKMDKDNTGSHILELFIIHETSFHMACFRNFLFPYRWWIYLIFKCSISLTGLRVIMPAVGESVEKYDYWLYQNLSIILKNVTTDWPVPSWRTTIWETVMWRNFNLSNTSPGMHCAIKLD